jgi:hypothetical protein
MNNDAAESRRTGKVRGIQAVVLVEVRRELERDLEDEGLSKPDHRGK